MCRDHIVRQFLLQTGAEFCWIECYIVFIISANKACLVVGKAPDCTPSDIKFGTNYSFNFCRLNAVTVDFDHIAFSATNCNIIVRQHLRQITAVIITIAKNFLGFFRKIDVSACIGVFKDKLSDFSRGNIISFLVNNPILQIELRFTNGAHIILFVYTKHRDNKTAFALGVHIVVYQTFKMKMIGRFAAYTHFFQKRSCFSCKLLRIGRRNQKNRYPVYKQIFYKCKRIF